MKYIIKYYSVYNRQNCVICKFGILIITFSIFLGLYTTRFKTRIDIKWNLVLPNKSHGWLYMDKIFAHEWVEMNV